jgi:hypothetical protein
MAEGLKFARPIVRRGASLYANQAWWQLLKERQDGATLAFELGSPGGRRGIADIAWPVP